MMMINRNIKSKGKLQEKCSEYVWLKLNSYLHVHLSSLKILYLVFKNQFIWLLWAFQLEIKEQNKQLQYILELLKEIRFLKTNRNVEIQNMMSRLGALLHKHTFILQFTLLQHFEFTNKQKNAGTCTEQQLKSCKQPKNQQVN